MNDLVNRPDSLGSLAAVAAEATSGSTGTLLRLLRDGIWVYGADNEEPEEGSLWAVNPYSFEHGYISWFDSKVQGEVMVPHNQPLPPRNDLPASDGSWDDQLSFQLKCLNGEDAGLEVIFKTTSVGGKRAVGAIAKAIAAQANAGEEAVVPVVTLGVDSYQHKKYGKIYTPELNVEKWITMAGQEAEPEPEPEPEPAKPAARRRRKRA